MSSSACDGGNDNAEMECHQLGMFRLTSGAWLGDTFVREAIPSAIQAAREIRKGFGKKSARGGSEDDDSDNIEGGNRFATRSMGLERKAALLAL